MSSTIGIQNLIQALGRSRATFVAHVGAGATTTTIPLADLNLGGTNLAGNLVLLDAGALGPGSQPTVATISSNTATSLTVPALSTAPVQGATVWIFAENTINVYSSDQIVSSPLSSPVTMQNAATATGLGTALPVSGMGTARIALSITGTATVTWVGVGPDGGQYTLYAFSGAGGASQTATKSGLYELNVRGLSSVYAQVSSYTSGTVTAIGWAQAIPVNHATPNYVSPWRQIATIPYTSFAASSTLYYKIQGQFNPTAKRRVLLIANGLNQPFSSSILYYPSDSLLVDGTNPAYAGGSQGSTSLPVSSGVASPFVTAVYDSAQYPGVGSAVDSALLSLPMGSTAPTSGNVYIWVREVF
jgi:hypothetical protein